MSAADALADSLPPTTLVVGKGGVGKTTCAAALALQFGRGSRTLLLSTDPARALPSVLNQPVAGEPTPVTGGGTLEARQLDAAAARDRFMRRWGEVIRVILDHGTYLDATDIGPLVDTALPGSDEIFSALTLAELLVEGGSSYERIVVDTAPTGHTLRLLNLPRTFRALVRLLDAMQEKHRFMVRTLTRTYRADDADEFLRTMSRLVTALDESLADASRCAAVMVTNTQPLVLEETRRYLQSLAELRIRVAAVVWNSTPATGALDTDAKHYLVPRLDTWPVGVAGLTRWSSELRAAKAVSRVSAVKRGRAPAGGATGATPGLDVLLRSLTIVAGKGGVGKTTVATALALYSAESRQTLLVSTDPAPSLADALGQPVPDADTAVRGVDRLSVRQMDATAAFARLRAEYQARVDAIFDAVVARGADLTHDRAITRELLSLAPPGIDEIYALSLISDALVASGDARVIVDPAPTGHLLRLLEMPALALEWTHQLMRLILKYKDIAGLGETAQDLLQFARNLRALDAVLRDPARAGLVLVALDEPVVRAETARLATEARRLGVAVAGVVLNRARSGAPLPVVSAPVQFEAPEVDPPPSGAVAIRRWTSSWHLFSHPARSTDG